MRNTRIVWSLAALIIVLLGIGVGGYAQLGSASSHLPAASARAVAPTVPAAVPPLTTPERTDRSPTAPAARNAPTTRVFGAPPVDRGNARRTQAPAPTTTPVPAATAARAATPARSARPAMPAVPRTATVGREALGVYVVQPGDTLWDLAATHLGNPNGWVDLFDLNRGRAEPGGAVMANPNRINVGWTLELPLGATSLSPGSVSSPTAVVSGSGHGPTRAVTSSLVTDGGSTTLCAAAGFDEAGWSI